MDPLNNTFKLNIYLKYLYFFQLKSCDLKFSAIPRVMLNYFLLVMKTR